MISPFAALAQTVNQVGSSDASQKNFQLIPCNAAPGANQIDPTTGKPFDTLTTNPVPCDYNAFITTVQRFINLFLYLAIFIAVIMIVIAGFKYLTAGGNTSKTESAKKIIYAVVIGMIIAFLSYAIVYYVVVTLEPGGAGSATLLQAPFNTSIPLQKQ